MSTWGHVDRAVSLQESTPDGTGRQREGTLWTATAGPRPDWAQFFVHDGTGFVARVDFAWPRQCVAVEYGGRWRGERQNVARDRRRPNRITAAGWTGIFATAEDLHDPVPLVARIGAALAAAL